MVLIDLSTALLGSRITLIHVLNELQRAGIECCVWSTLERATTRDALQEAGLLEAFDDIYYMERLKRLDSYDVFENAQWIELDALRRPLELLRRLGLPEARMPQWLGWLGKPQQQQQLLAAGESEEA